jgi:hypothetical protein
MVIFIYFISLHKVMYGPNFKVICDLRPANMAILNQKHFSVKISKCTLDFKRYPEPYKLIKM